MCMLCKESIEIIEIILIALIAASTTNHRGGGRCTWTDDRPGAAKRHRGHCTGLWQTRLPACATAPDNS